MTVTLLQGGQVLVAHEHLALGGVVGNSRRTDPGNAEDVDHGVGGRIDDRDVARSPVVGHPHLALPRVIRRLVDARPRGDFRHEVVRQVGDDRDVPHRVHEILLLVGAGVGKVSRSESEPRRRSNIVRGRRDCDDIAGEPPVEPHLPLAGVVHRILRVAVYRDIGVAVERHRGGHRVRRVRDHTHVVRAGVGYVKFTQRRDVGNPLGVDAHIDRRHDRVGGVVDDRHIARAAGAVDVAPDEHLALSAVVG